MRHFHRSEVLKRAGSVFLCGVAAVLLCISFAGCATVRRARAVQKGDRIPPGQRTLTAVEAGLGTNSVLTLEEALRIAVAYHPAIAEASQSVVSASAQLGEARSAYLPSVGGSASYSRSSNKQKGGTASDSGSSDSYRAGLDASLLLFDFGKTPAAVRQARARLLAAECSFRAARNDVVFGVRSAFYSLCEAGELLQVAEESVGQYKTRLAQVRDFAEVGKRTRYDVTKAEVDLGNAKLALINARNSVTSARAALNRNLGLAEEPGYRVGKNVFEEYAGKIGELMAMARQKHPEMLALKAQEALASAGVDQAVSDLYPQLTLGGQYTGSGSSLPLVWNWSGVVQAAVDFFTGSRKTGKINEAVAQLCTARARLAAREQQLCQDLSSAFSQLESSRQRMELTALIARQAQESMDLINESYKVGKASSVEVTDAQVTLAGAKADQVKARFEYQTAVAQIKHAIGDEQ